MQLESLKIFCDVVRWSSFSRGAEENGISQSSASQAVHQLEARLGVKLIDRSKRPLVPTPQGKIYYEGCKELVERYLELENRVKALGDEDAVVGTVGVAAIYSVGLHHMSQYVKIFETRHPRASVRLEYLHPSRVLDRSDQRRGRAGPGLVSQEVARSQCDHLARGGDGPGRPSIPSVRGSPGRARGRAGRRAVHRFRRGLADPPRDRSLPAASRRPCRSRTRIRQYRKHQAGRRDPVGRRHPARALARRRRSRRGRSSPSAIDGQDPVDPPDSPAGDHPPAARQARSGRGSSSWTC